MVKETIRVSLSILAGWGIYLMALPLAIAIASLFGFTPLLLWLSLPAALLAGLITGHIHSRRAVLAGAIAACPLIIILALTTWISGGRMALANYGAAETDFLVFSILSPVLGAIGGWIGAHWLPPSRLSGVRPDKIAGSWGVSGGIMFGIALVVLFMNLPGVPLFWLMAGIALVSFSYAGYLWVYKPGATRDNNYGRTLFAIFGALSVVMAAYLWTSPLPVMHWSLSVGLMLGALLGVAILRLGIKN